jgi:hypothetical protein
MFNERELTGYEEDILYKDYNKGMASGGSGYKHLLPGVDTLPGPDTIPG